MQVLYAGTVYRYCIQVYIQYSAYCTYILHRFKEHTNLLGEVQMGD